MAEQKKTRIAVVNSHPIQYFAPMYAYLNRDESLEVTALYCSDVSLRGSVDRQFGQTVKWDVDLLGGYRSVFLGERAKKRTPDGFWSLIVPEIWSEVRSGRYDAVILHGYSYAALLLAFAAAKSRGIPVMMRCDTHAGLPRKPWKRKVRDAVLSFAYRHVDAFLAIGTANKEFYLSLGVPNDRVFQVPFAVDNDRFMRAAQAAAKDRLALRKEFGLPDGLPVILFASKFMRQKHPDSILRAAKTLSDRGTECAVLMVGSGEMDEELKSLTQSLGLKNVVFTGFVNQQDLPKAFVASDVFALPSENDAWGLIVNEVMCAGLPVVAGEGMGCVRDLVFDNLTGCRVKAGDSEALVLALEPLLKDPDVRAAMGSAAQNQIARWSYAECAMGVKSAAAKVLKRTV